MYPVYKGIPRQYGHGLGSLFQSAIKSATPLLTPVVNSAVRAMKREGARQSTGAIADVLIRGKSPKQILKQRGTQALKNIGKAAALSLGRSIMRQVSGGGGGGGGGKRRRPQRRAAQSRIKKQGLKATRHSSNRDRRRSRPLRALSSLFKKKGRALDIFD